MPDIDPRSVGIRIRKQRTRLGFTREALAEQLGVTPKCCSDIELGLKGMSVQTLCKLSDILFLSTDYILFGEITDGLSGGVVSLLEHCPAEKRPYAEELLRVFLQSVGSPSDDGSATAVAVAEGEIPQTR